MQEVHGLENLVSEFREGNAGVQTAGYDIFRQHRIDVEVLAGNGLVVSGSSLNVNVDDSTIEINADALQVKDGGIDANKINSSAIGDGLTGGSGSTIQALSDITGGSNLSRSVNVSANGLSVKVDSTSIIENGSEQLAVGTVDCGIF